VVSRQSFTYDVRRIRNGTEVEIGCCHWKQFLASSLWSILWLAATAAAYESWWGKTYFGFWFLFFCASFIGLGIFNAVHAMLWRTLTLSPSGLKLRSSFFGVAMTRSIELGSVSSFGLGRAGHSGIPVLRIELRTRATRTKWIVLASGITEAEVKAFLQDVEAQGFQLPR
jgi:hypothetical protein